MLFVRLIRLNQETREPCAGRVSLTDAGRSLVSDASSQFTADVSALLDRLSQHDRRALTTIVTRLLVAHAADQGIELFPETR